ncbi:MAG: hypothetical protein KGL29_15330 [Alphaproteobacteria bacterium]|nr:hypothetical protein [Alphaproteobacteria bacterium]
MKVIECSAQKLRLRLGSTGLNIGICTLDRESDLAAITRLALIVPYHHKQIAL